METMSVAIVSSQTLMLVGALALPRKQVSSLGCLTKDAGAKILMLVEDDMGAL